MRKTFFFEGRDFADPNTYAARSRNIIKLSISAELLNQSNFDNIAHPKTIYQTITTEKSSESPSKRIVYSFANNSKTETDIFTTEIFLFCFLSVVWHPIIVKVMSSQL